MGRAPCCDKAKVKKGPWSPEEDAKLKDYMHSHGPAGNWIALPQKVGLKRCGKSCRLRWLNYLRPNLRHGEFSDDEDRLILTLFSTIGSRWSIIAAQLPGRTDNDIKNYWNTKLKKKLMGMSMINHNPQRIKPNTAYHQSPLLLSPAFSSTSPYNTTVPNYHNTPSSSTLSFTGFDQSTLLSNPSNGLSSASASTILQQRYHQHQLSPTPMQSSYLVFGGAPEPSCSSINGSSSVEDDDQKIINSDPLIWEETAPLMDCGLQEIKQLISTTTTANYFDESNTGERAMMYY